jgi:hypothetical protein
MVTVYRSKIDAWMLGVLLMGMAVAAFGISHLPPAMPPPARGFAHAVAVIAIGLPVWVLLSTRYALSPQTLSVRSGPFSWNISLASITAVAPSSSNLSSPALSMDRLRIDYGGGKSLLISPRDQAKFLRELEALRRRPG